jgi:CheY-like chemotaxis protein/HPt (histidine-containing phosphotransfer) domain-containing protein
MHQFRILHVDDEPDIREVVELSLGLDPCFLVRSCASGEEALVVAASWMPQAILCDVMMPVMDGPATLARLRQNPQTANIPVIFMTARAQRRELEQFKAIGAAGVICKPFDPMTLADELRRLLGAAGMAALSTGFTARLRSDAEALAGIRTKLADAGQRPAAVEEIRSIAHSLAGSAGLFGFDQIGDEAALLEDAAIETLRGGAGGDGVERELDSLLRSIAKNSAKNSAKNGAVEEEELMAGATPAWPQPGSRHSRQRF